MEIVLKERCKIIMMGVIIKQEITIRQTIHKLFSHSFLDFSLVKGYNNIKSP